MLVDTTHYVFLQHLDLFTACMIRMSVDLFRVFGIVGGEEWPDLEGGISNEKC